MMPVVCAYYTTGSQYEREARGFRESAEAIGVPIRITAVESRGDWQANTSYKPAFVKSMRKRFAGQAIVYNDVDAFILRRPSLFESIDCDVAAVMFAGHTLLSGTVYFGASAKADEVVDRWASLCEQYPCTMPRGLHPKFPGGGEAWDQRLLHLAILQADDVRFVELPPEYAYMIGLSQKQYPSLHPVILHTHGHLRCTDEIT